MAKFVRHIPASADRLLIFQSCSAKQGNKAFSTNHNGATYYFISAENQNTFTKDPGKYLPQFGGYCAFGMAKMNQKVPVNPETFLIDDGKLYLFFNDYYEGAPFNTIVQWVNNEANLKPLAEGNWSALKD